MILSLLRLYFDLVVFFCRNIIIDISVLALLVPLVI